MKRIFFLFCISLLFNFACSEKEEPIKEEVIDTVTDIDGNEYNVIDFRGVKWIFQNLRTSRYRDGTVIPEIKDNLEWEETASSAYSWHNNQNAANEGFGKLYNWEAANCCEICPEGFRLPTPEDFNRVMVYLGVYFCDYDDCPPYLTWVSKSGIMEGKRTISGHFITPKDYYTGFWTDKNSNESDAVIYEVEYIGGTRMFKMSTAHKSSGLSIKCVEDR